MAFLHSFYALRRAHSAKRLAMCITTCLLSVVVGCSDASDAFDDTWSPGFAADASSAVPEASTSGYDASSTPWVNTPATTPGADASSSPGSSATKDAGGAASDASSSATSDASSDAGRTVADASTAAEGGIFPFPFPDLFPVQDAGASNPNKPDGGRDVHGPCKDLALLCFDFIDMWINAECQTCNGGKGCQGCAIPFAY